MRMKNQMIKQLNDIIHLNWIKCALLFGYWQASTFMVMYLSYNSIYLISTNILLKQYLKYLDWQWH